jgi:glycosyltransferase involved in cell wall biosynthesis
MLTLDPTLPWPLRQLVRIGERALSLLTDAIVAVSSGERFHIVAQGISPRKVHLIVNEIDPPALPPRDALRRKLGLSPEQVAIGFVGRLSHHKAIDIMVTAFMRVHAAAPRTRLIVIGDGDAGIAARHQAEMAGCAGGISWLGARDALPYYNAFDLLAQPSRYEALSYVLLEAASAGLPIIATDVGGTRDVVEDDVNGRVVPANDPEAFGEGLLAIITTPEKLHRYATAAKGRTVSGGRTRMVRNTLALYRSLMLASPRNRGF